MIKSAEELPADFGKIDGRDHPDTTIANLRAEIERLRAALQKIVDDAESDDGATSWDGADIARAALAYEQGTGESK